MSGDCGGDCWGCIGDIEARIGGEPEYNLSVLFIPKEIAWGWREADGTAKRPEAFLAAPPRFIRLRRRHSVPDAPDETWSALNDAGHETRRLDLWSDGRATFAGSTAATPYPSLKKLAANRDLTATIVSPDAFAEAWTVHVLDGTGTESTS